MLDSLWNVRAFQKPHTPQAAHKVMIAWVMALLLLVAATFSANQALHQALHHGSPAAGHFCLVCSLAKGQAEPPVFPLVFFLGLSFLLFFVILPGVDIGPVAFDDSLSRGRAPPQR